MYKESNDEEWGEKNKKKEYKSKWKEKQERITWNMREEKKKKKIHYPVFAFCQLYNSSLIIGPKTRKEAFKQTESTDLFSKIIG